MIEHKVGDVVEDNGVKYRAIARDGSCLGCDYNDNCRLDFDRKISIFGYCSSFYRYKIKDNIKWEIVK